MKRQNLRSDTALGLAAIALLGLLASLSSQVAAVPMMILVIGLVAVIALVLGRRLPVGGYPNRRSSQSQMLKVLWRAIFFAVLTLLRVWFG